MLKVAWKSTNPPGALKVKIVRVDTSSNANQKAIRNLIGIENCLSKVPLTKRTTSEGLPRESSKLHGRLTGAIYA